MNRKPGVGIVNYGIGNVASLRSSLMKIGYRPHMLEKPSDFENAKVIIIPGVGAFPKAMKQLERLGLDNAILRAHDIGKRIVGICVGMQLLAEIGHELMPTKGLGLLRGKILPHPDGLQVGWMSLKPQLGSDPSITGNKVYFNHSYYLENANNSALYVCQSSTIEHAALVRQDEVIGIQFHPEKSQRFGLKILGRAIRGEIT